MEVPTRISRQLTGGNVQEGKMAVMDTHSDCDDDDVKDEAPVNVCMIGTGEYTTGYVHGGASDSDKGAGGEEEKRYSRAPRRVVACWSDSEPGKQVAASQQRACNYISFTSNCNSVTPIEL